jgi:hypothetical protein
MTKVKDAVRDLDHDLLTIEAQGDYAGAKKMLDTLGVVRPILKRTLARLHDIPTDIEPIFVTADEVAPSSDSPPIEKKAPAAKKPRRKRR